MGSSTDNTVSPIRTTNTDVDFDANYYHISFFILLYSPIVGKTEIIQRRLEFPKVKVGFQIAQFAYLRILGYCWVFHLFSYPLRWPLPFFYSLYGANWAGISF